MSEETPIKRGPGRPRKVAVPVDREPAREDIRDPSPNKILKMRAQPNWESIDPSEEDTPDRLRVPAGAIPDGLSAQWVTDSVFGQNVPQHRADFEKRGWTPVHGDDFDGALDGVFLPRGSTREINVDGMVLMVRPSELTERAKRLDKLRAMEAVHIKEQALRGGDLSGVTLDTRHPTAVNSNKINKSVERIIVPKD